MTDNILHVFPINDTAEHQLTTEQRNCQTGKQNDMKEVIEKLDRIEKLLLSQKKILTLDEAAEYLNIEKSYMYKLTSGRIIPHSKPNGKTIYFEKEKLDEWALSRPIKTRQEINIEAATYVTSRIAETKNDNETVGYFCNRENISTRLKGILLFSHYKNRGTRLISSISKTEFLSFKGAGTKMWSEFVNARGY